MEKKINYGMNEPSEDVGAPISRFERSLEKEIASLRAELEGKDRRLALMEEVAEKARLVVHTGWHAPWCSHITKDEKGCECKMFNLRTALRALEGK